MTPKPKVTLIPRLHRASHAHQDEGHVLTCTSTALKHCTQAGMSGMPISMSKDEEKGFKAFQGGFFFPKGISKKWVYNELQNLQVHTLSPAELITVMNSARVSNIKQTVTYMGKFNCLRGSPCQKPGGYL